MDTDQIIENSRARFEHEASRRLLEEKYQAKMIFAYNGGMWRAGPELLNLLQACSAEGSVVILDLYKNPVQVNPADLKFLAFERWQEQMNAWLAEHQESRSRR
jgi:hypothetical protein